MADPLDKLTPGQIRFFARIARALLWFDDRHPKTFKFLIQATFWGLLVGLPVALIVRSSDKLQRIADDPVEYFFRLATPDPIIGALIRWIYHFLTH